MEIENRQVGPTTMSQYTQKEQEELVASLPWYEEYISTRGYNRVVAVSPKTALQEYRSNDLKNKQIITILHWH